MHEYLLPPTREFAIDPLISKRVLRRYDQGAKG
jgi:hypothetical protein